ETWRSGVDEMPAQVRLPVAERYGLELLVQGLKELRLADVDCRDGRRVHFLEVRLPREIRSQRLQLRRRHPVIGRVRITPLDAGHRRLGELCLDIDHGPGFSRGLAGIIPEQGENFR